jgi:hypothetical protein
MWPVLFLLLAQATGAQSGVAELTIEADGRQWGAFTRLVQADDGSATVTLEDGWIDPAFLQLWWPDEATDTEALTPGTHTFDAAACRGQRVEVRQELSKERMSRMRSWTLLGACAIACEVAAAADGGRLALKSLTFRVEGIGSAM